MADSASDLPKLVRVINYANNKRISKKEFMKLYVATQERLAKEREQTNKKATETIE